MNQPLDPDRQLTSWKEIARYFGVNVRTVQKWEIERALPVHRLPAKRGRVAVSVSELEAWQRSGEEQRNGAVAPDSGAANKTIVRAGLAGVPRVLRISGVVAVLAIAGIMVFWLGGRLTGWSAARHGAPATWKVAKDTLIVVDARNREVFRHEFETHLNAPQYSGMPDAFGYEFVVVRDVDGDGHIETLFVREPLVMGPDCSEMYCFTDDGSVRWRYRPNRAVSTKAESFEPTYKISNFWVGPLTPDGPNSILLISTHDPYYPTQVALLSADGKLQREYWHSGHIGLPGRLLVSDLDGDGVRELYLGGISNGYRQATLVVLDPRTMSGASTEQSEAYQLGGFSPGSERARLLFPRSCMSRALDVWNRVERLAGERDGILVHVYETSNDNPPVVHYHLDKNLRLRSLAFSAMFERRHLELEATGVLKHHLTREEKTQLEHIRRLPSSHGQAAPESVTASN